MREASAWLEQLLSLDAGAGEQAAPPALRLTALYGAARMAMSQGHEEQATALARANLGVFAQARGESVQAAASFAESYTRPNFQGTAEPWALHASTLPRAHGCKAI